jgi:hypothetical protein
MMVVKDVSLKLFNIKILNLGNLLCYIFKFQF